MKKLLIGNEAVARGAYEAGLTIVSSYPGTPSTEITECLAKYDDVYSEWASNEKVAVEVAIGGSFVGGRTMACMKHVGLNVAADPVFTVSYIGVNGGLVLCVADDPGMHSSQNEQDTRMVAMAAKVPVLEPSDSAECKEYTKLAFELSEKYDTPFIIRLSTRVSHSQGLVEIGERTAPKGVSYTKNPQKNVMMPAMAKARHVFVEQRLNDMKEYAETADINTVEINDTKIGIITAGSSYQYAKEAFPNASYLKLGMVYPLPEKLIRDFAEKVETLYVIEELDPVIETHCKKLGIEVHGKDTFPIIGEFNTTIIRKCISGEELPKFESEKDIPNRPPVMCPGCPHRGMYYVLHKLGLTVSGDIGCYTLGALPPLQSVDTCVCMGASVGVQHGMEKSAGREFTRNKVVSVIGDSTFIHSGITGLIDIVYNKGNSTVIILDNSITGMTGHQQNPTTGFTIKMEPTKQVDLIKLCNAIGVDRVRVCDPFDIKGFEEAVKEEISVDEPSVIISQRPCALLKNVKFPGPIEINQDKCVKCKMCMRIGCPAISAKDGVVSIDATQCNGCGLCKNLCKVGAIGGSAK